MCNYPPEANVKHFIARAAELREPHVTLHFISMTNKLNALLQHHMSRVTPAHHFVMSLSPVLSSLPHSASSLLGMSMLCHCDRDRSVGRPDKPVHLLQVAGDETCRWASLMSESQFKKERSERGNRNLHLQQSLELGSWGDLLRFHFTCSFFFPLALFPEQVSN